MYRTRTRRVRRSIHRAGASVFPIESLENRVLLSTIYVDASAPGVTQDGASWGTAYLDLQAGLGSAVAGDTIRVANGTYKPTAGTDRTISFGLKTGVILEGGYAGFGAPSPDVRDVVANPTLLSGDIGVSGVSSDNSYHVVSADAVEFSAVMDGFRVTGGNANGAGTASSGGGVYVVGVNGPTIRNSVIQNNSATGSGGGMFTSASIVLNGVAFTGNSSSLDGGGLAVITPAPSSAVFVLVSATLTNCSFTNNSSQRTGGGMTTIATPPTYGGASPASTGIVLTGCTFTGNSAAQTGGGLSNYAGESPFASLVVTDCNFIQNSSVDGGGGISLNKNSKLTMNTSEFIENTGGVTSGDVGGGALLIAQMSTATIGGSTFLRNQTSADGGAIMCHTLGAFTVTSCVFNGNTAEAGGAVYSWGKQSSLTNSSFAGNSASTNGGAVNANLLAIVSCTFNANTAVGWGGGLYGTPTIANVILWGNEAGARPQLASSQLGGAISVHEWDLIQPGQPKLGVAIKRDPQFIRPATPGLDGSWGTSDDDYGDLRLRASSPAVDEGRADHLPAGVITDVAGNPRLVDVPTAPNLFSTLDIGAYEAIPTLATDAGGPYKVIQGQSIGLTGTGASNVPGTLTYEWEWSGDSQFNEGSGVNPTFSTAGIPLFSVIPISVRVTDAASNAMVSSTTLTVLPEIVHVQASASGANNGSTWADAYSSLAPALEQTIPGQSVRVAGGVYKPTATTDRTATFRLGSVASIMGGYAGFGAPDPDARNVSLYPSILSGDIGMQGDASDNSYHVVSAIGVGGGRAVFDGFTVTGGNANGPESVDLLRRGGGMVIDSSWMSIANSTFIGNASASGGGAMDLVDTNVVFADSVFVRNRTFEQGGAIANWLSTVDFQRCDFNGNSTTNNNWGGGAFFHGSGTAKFGSCTFVGNTSGRDGGAIYVSSGQATTLGVCTLVGNVAANRGGALFINWPGGTFPRPTVRGCILWANSAPLGPQIRTTPSNQVNVFVSDIEGGGIGDASNINTDPQFVRMPSRGLDAQWGTADDDYGNLRLQATSPCIDATDMGEWGTGLDRDGNPRAVDYPGVNDSVPRVDMGALEAQLPLVVTAGTFDVNTQYSQGIEIHFNASIDPSTLTPSDVQLINLATGLAVDLGPSYTVDSTFARFPLPVLADGNYRVTLPAGSVANAAGALSVDFTFDFFILDGDANRDRKVDLQDLMILAANWMGTGKVFTQGDFNRDGIVNAVDLGILSMKWQSRMDAPLPSAPVPTAPPPVRSPVRAPTRAISLV